MEPREVDRWQRSLSALLAAGGGDDPEGFAEVVRLLDGARARLPQAAAQLREQGYSWADIARPLGVTRDAARQRFSARPPESGAWLHANALKSHTQTT